MGIQYGDNEYIKLFRKMINWEWYTDINTKVLFLHLLLKANWKDGNWQGIKYKRGQLIASIDTLATETGLTYEQIRTAIKHLKSTGEITYTKIAKGGLFTIVEYDKFQAVPTQNPHKTHTETQAEPTENPHDSQQYKNNKEYKEYKEERGELPPVKIQRYPAGKYLNVFLSAEEAAKLAKEFPKEADQMIDKLSEYMQTHRTSYKDDAHYALICKWIREDRAKPKQEQKKNAALNYSQRQYTNDDIAAIERKKLGLT